MISMSHLIPTHVVGNSKMWRFDDVSKGKIVKFIRQKQVIPKNPWLAFQERWIWHLNFCFLSQKMINFFTSVHFCAYADSHLESAFFFIERNPLFFSELGLDSMVGGYGLAAFQPPARPTKPVGGKRWTAKLRVVVSLKSMECPARWTPLDGSDIIRREFSTWDV